jgi:hypothetical protein
VISLPARSHLHREDSPIFVSSAVSVMLLLQIVGLTSDAGRKNLSLSRPYGLIYVAALPVVWFSAVLPGWVLLLGLSTTCGMSVMLTSSNWLGTEVELSNKCGSASQELLHQASNTPGAHSAQQSQ